MSKLYATIITSLVLFGWLMIEAYYTNNGHIDLRTLEFKKVYLSETLFGEPVGIVALKNYTIVLLFWWAVDWFLCNIKNDSSSHAINNNVRIGIFTFLVTATIFEAVYRANMWNIL